MRRIVTRTENVTNGYKPVAGQIKYSWKVKRKGKLVSVLN
jgi:hypothetical protein